MTKLLRGVLMASAAALAVGLLLHLLELPIGDRIINGGLIALVVIPVANTMLSVAGLVRENQSGNNQ